MKQSRVIKVLIFSHDVACQKLYAKLPPTFAIVQCTASIPLADRTELPDADLVLVSVSDSAAACCNHISELVPIIEPPIVALVQGATSAVIDVALNAGAEEVITAQESAELLCQRLKQAAVRFWQKRELMRMRELERCVAEEVRFEMRQDGCFRYVSESVTRLTGYSTQAFLDDPQLLTRLVQDEDSSHWRQHLTQADMLGHSKTEVRIRDRSSQRRWIAHKISRSEADPDVLCASCIDISPRKAYEERIRSLADFDPLTQLPNRRLLHRKLEELIRFAKVEGKQFAAMFVDLDRFKNVNDTLGHNFGDQLLVQISAMMTQLITPDHLLCRFGGDEFIVITPLSDKPLSEATRLAQKLLELLRRPFKLQDKVSYIGASIGVSVFPGDASTAQDLIKYADIAMFQSKRSGRGEISRFDAGMAQQRQYRVELENRFREALEQRRFLLHLQPIIDLLTGRVCSVEALVRWLDPELGLIPPNDFIPMAEENGLIGELGQQVIELACEEVQRLRRSDIRIPVAVNLSVLQLSDSQLFKSILATVDRYDIELSSLHFEITESMLFEHTEEKLNLLSDLQARGSQVAIDDFGTGFSSLSNLARLPASVMKIDRSFINSMLDSENDRLVVNGVVQLARTLGKKVVAEGIESEEHRELLMCLGCDCGQGFLFAKPATGTDFIKWFFAATERGILHSSRQYMELDTESL